MLKWKCAGKYQKLALDKDSKMQKAACPQLSTFIDSLMKLQLFTFKPTKRAHPNK